MESSEATGFGARFQLTYLTNDPDMAAAADAAGVDYVGIDIERLGKAARQSVEPGSRISSHQLSDLGRLKPALKRARLFCRLDPPHPGQPAQVEAALEGGAEVLMLPYFRRPSQAARFADLVAGRARVVLLVETTAAAWEIEHLASLPGVDGIMAGLNDLTIDAGNAGPRFRLLTSPLMLAMAQTVLASGKRFSVGGLGRWDDTAPPTPPDLIYAQYPRLGAQGAWLARTFERGLDGADWPGAVAALRRRLDHWASQDPMTLEAARRELASWVGLA